MRSLLEVILLALQLYTYLIIASAILSWLVAFNVINARNDVVRSIWRFLDAVTEPALRPIRRILPNLGGIDISPVILILIIIFLQNLIARVMQQYIPPTLL
ncbi:YggT family protein [Microvirga puerhi]|uniref:YggT family protein n=1 Tax=Microvirga puerhi TaxID=2876078 RepID=A0ABS7VJW2_9HYPH|nr:YggT family protein [Microvirga puerhi]MBZ6075815.1 YggT family protein [Microvirga puerhi]